MFFFNISSQDLHARFPIFNIMRWKWTMHYIYPVYRCIEHLLHVQLHIHIRYQTFYSQTLHLSAVYMSVLRSGFEFCVSITDCSCAKILRVFLQNSAEIYPLRVLSSDHALIWAPKTYNRDDSGYISIQCMNWY